MKILKITLDDEGRMFPETEGDAFTTIELFGIARVIAIQAETIERFNTENNLLLVGQHGDEDEMGTEVGRSDPYYGH